MTIKDKLLKKRNELQTQIEELNHVIDALDETVLKHINLVTDKQKSEKPKQVNPMTELKEKLANQSLE